MKALLGILLATYFFTIFILSLLLAGFHPLTQYALATPRIEQDKMTAPPLFSDFNIIQEKKDAFFDYLAPLIKKENKQILKQRQVLSKIDNYRQAGNELSHQQQRIIGYYSAIYSVDTSDTVQAQLQELDIRVNIIPVSLALAQATIESGWGTSRFAQKGNNYFGQWCYTSNCGLVPQARSNDQDHQVKQFDSARDSIQSYMLNLNTHSAYKKLRQLRSIQVSNKLDISGLALASGLMKYSERKERYIHDLIKMIKREKLEQYTE